MCWQRVATVLAVLAGAGGGCSGDDGGDLDAFCATAERFAVDNPAAALDAYDPADPVAAAGMLRDAADRIAAWAEEAPGEIDEDVEVVSDTMAALADEFESPGAASAASLREQVAAVEAASGRVVDFTRTNCRVDLEPAASSG